MGVNTALGSMTTFGPEIRRIAERLLTLYGQLSDTVSNRKYLRKTHITLIMVAVFF